MTPLSCMQLTVVHLWRVMRAWRLPCVAFGIVVLLTANILISTRNQSRFSRDSNEHEAFEIKHFKTHVLEPPKINSQEFQDHPKLSLSRLLKQGYQAVSPEPEVKEELSLGVHEEENSAREVLDGDLADKFGRRMRMEDNAANEVNSIEPELNVDVKKYDESSLNEEGDRSTRNLPDPLLQNDKQDGHLNHNWRNLTRTELNSLSVLGRRLYLNENIGTVQNKNFTILMWKTGRSVERRLINQYGKEKLDPFHKCSVKNCKISYEDSLSSTADAIVIHLHRTKGPSSFPNRTNFNQRWIWLTDESPYHTFMVAKNKNMEDYNGYFNWSMSYRMDSDIPVPYGRTILMTDAEASLYKKEDYFNLKSKIVAVMGSNCGGKNHRWNYVKELQKYMDVDTYGACGNLKCPGHFTEDCKVLDQYKFYLAFENGNCREYITEKVWWNAIAKGAVPVVMGGKIEEYKKILPPDSFIHIDEFLSPHHLAKHLLSVANNSEKYMGYHAWRSNFRVANEHGYFKSDIFHYCRICEALNYNDQAPKVYNNMEVFWNDKTQCYPPTWENRMTGT